MASANTSRIARQSRVTCDRLSLRTVNRGGNSRAKQRFAGVNVCRCLPRGFGQQPDLDGPAGTFKRLRKRRRLKVIAQRLRPSFSTAEMFSVNRPK